MSKTEKMIRPSDGVKKGGYTPTGSVPRPSGPPKQPSDSKPSSTPKKS
ncbi:hypothetical protein GKE82_05615 [Conexibacter sp. W3-3-2]|nr:hypothetical protein [Conexibacter sp. W3-3-2]MTD43797.1 hypothetical protein [Conexibacter sp. W3-3-2]